MEMRASFTADKQLWTPPDGVFGRTYWLLRWGMPVLLLWLTFGVVVAWCRSGAGWPMTSISAYYYTDARTVFSGVLISVGVLLIVIQGRTPWEDALMNVAGALAPYVALLPTPIPKDDCTADYCTTQILDGKLPDTRSIIEFDVVTAIPIWALLCGYLGFRAWTVRNRDNRELGPAVFAAGLTFLLGVAALLLYFVGDEGGPFDKWAHLCSAALMLGLLMISIVPFALWIGPSSRRAFQDAPRWRNNGFWVLLWVTFAAMFLWGAAALTKHPWDHKVLAIEIVAIVPFSVYWLMQGLALQKIDKNNPVYMVRPELSRRR